MPPFAPWRASDPVVTIRAGAPDPVGRTRDHHALVGHPPLGHGLPRVGERPERLDATIRASERRMSFIRIPQNSKPYRCDATGASIDTIDAAWAVGLRSRG